MKYSRKEIDRAGKLIISSSTDFDVRELREAYPSYFLNADEFISELSDFQKNCRIKGYIK